MCKNIVGSENHVNTIRLMNAVCDNVSRDKTRVDIASGSFGEGLQMLGSDLDILWVLQFIEVRDTTTSKVVNPIKPYLSLTTYDTKPGFAMLRLVSSPYSALGVEHNDISRVVYNLISCTSKTLNIIHAYFMSVVCRNKCQSMYVSSVVSNKNQYKQHHTSLGYLLMNINHDAVSGWLMIASHFYMQKQYKKFHFIYIIEVYT
ncbi:unnamed protein product [Mytilus edulis]|uniref:Uncharacterized protein n=1 Tax=Mytilus edulis TaxID=6550 RepID=A0A8S3PTE5_MYTED|nr:unnamed protein product [Mytilus edulis]